MESRGISEAAQEVSQSEENEISCVRGINQLVLVLQPDNSTQYVLLSEERALREAAAKQAALEAAEQGLVSHFHLSKKPSAIIFLKQPDP